MNWIDAIRGALGLGTGTPVLSEARAKMRITANMPVVLGLPKGVFIEGKTMNVNSRGLTVEIPTPMRRGQKVDVVVKGSAGSPRSPQGLRDLRLTATVIWSRRRPQGGEVDAGLAFVSFGHHRPDDILAFLRHELAVPILDDKQKRKFRRISADWSVEFSTPQSERRRGKMCDVSPCGLLFTSSVPLLLWSEVALSIQPDVDSGRPPIRAHGVVRRCTKLPGEESWEIACPLMEMTEPERQRLIANIEQHLQKSRHR